MSDGNQETYISDVEGYLAKLKGTRPRLKENLVDEYSKAGKQEKSFFYRGENNSANNLEPRLFRKNKDTGERLYSRDAEKNLLEELAAAYHDEFRQDKTAFERILRAQHYGLPTRLLDVTLNPLIALYFACWDKDKKNENEDGQVHIFCTLNKYVLGAESDRLRIICNLAYLKAEDKEQINENSRNDELFAEMNEKARNSAEACGGEAYNRLIYAIQRESPGFQRKIKKRYHLRRAFFVRPLYSNARIRA